ncbi:PAS domain-containing sensor histidine kinase [Actinomycetota bacterium Odt1-20B]
MAEPEPEDLYRAVLHASADGIVAVDGAGVVRACNPAAAALLERPLAEVIGSEFGFPLVAGESTEVVLVLPAGGTRTVEMRVTAARLDGERLYVAALRDATRRREAELALEHALEERTVVVAVAAHQLHNPLAALGALVHVLREEPPGLTAERRTEIVERIAERTAHLQSLVRKLLTAARIDGQVRSGGQGQPGAVEPDSEPVGLLGLLLERLAEADTRDMDLRIGVPPGLTALVDRLAFAEVIGNYLENAATYSHGPVTITARDTGHRIEVRVADQGPGVPESFVPHLFERYRRGPQAEAPGTGLGLWIARSLARAGGGDAWYEPGRPVGAVFCVSVRRADSRS